jgi:hypothetical protein
VTDLPLSSPLPADARPDDGSCPHCGGPMERATVFLTGAKSCGPALLPPHCPSKTCREARDDAAIADMVARGIIDP